MFIVDILLYFSQAIHHEGKALKNGSHSNKKILYHCTLINWALVFQKIPRNCDVLCTHGNFLLNLVPKIQFAHEKGKQFFFANCIISLSFCLLFLLLFSWYFKSTQKWSVFVVPNKRQFLYSLFQRIYSSTSKQNQEIFTKYPFRFHGNIAVTLYAYNTDRSLYIVIDWTYSA